MSNLGDKTIKELTELQSFLESEHFPVENDFDTYKVSLALLKSLFYDPLTNLLYPEKIPNIPIVDLGTKISDFNVSLGSSRMLTAVLNAASLSVTFIELLSAAGTVNTLTLVAEQGVTLGWDEDIKWAEGVPLESMEAGDEYVLHISTKGELQSDIVINFTEVLAVSDNS